MNVLQWHSGFLSKKALLCHLSVLSFIAPIALPVGILGTAHSAEAQGVVIARGNPGRIVPKVLDMLTAAFGLGSAVIEHLPQTSTRSSLNSRQLWLIEAVRYEEYMHYQQTGGYLIPFTPQNLNVLMSRVGAYSNEAEFVATVMYYFGSR